MKKCWIKKAFFVTRWDRDGARIIGLVRGWETVLWPLIIIFLFLLQGFWLIALLVEYAPWLALSLPAAFVLALGYHFDVAIDSSGAIVRTRIWGFVVASEFFSHQDLAFRFDPGEVDPFSSDESQDRAVIYSKSELRSVAIGDNFSALALHHLFDEACCMAHDDVEVATTVTRTLFETVPAPKESRPTDIREVAAKVLAHARSEPLVFVEGWSVEAKRRVGVFVRSMNQLQLVFDGYVDSGQIEGLRERIAQDARVLEGGWDEMAHTARRRWVWSDEPFVLYRRGRRYLRVASQAIWVGNRIIHIHEIARVLSVAGAITTGVDLELTSGERVKVARHVNWGAILDPLYDGWELEFDTIWCESLARSLGEAIEVEWSRDDY